MKVAHRGVAVQDDPEDRRNGVAVGCGTSAQGEAERIGLPWYGGKTLVERNAPTVALPIRSGQVQKVTARGRPEPQEIVVGHPGNPRRQGHGVDPALHMPTRDHGGIAGIALEFHHSRSRIGLEVRTQIFKPAID